MTLNQSGVGRAGKDTRIDASGNVRCGRCGKDKPRNQFYSNIGYCKPCQREYYDEKNRIRKEERRQLKEQKANYIRENAMRLKQTGISYAKIAKELGCTRQRIQQVCGPTDSERAFILALDGNHCRMCGASEDEARLDIHHIVYSGSINDTITVCLSCHQKLEALCRQFGVEMVQR
jgi:hypothetical protein